MAPSPPTETYSRDDVAKNNHSDALWTIIDSKVYDLTDFLDAHPGGAAVLLQVAGKDATADFYNLHRHEVLTKYDKTLLIGTVAGETPQVVQPGPGELSQVPYAEPLWLTPAFRSPYFNDSHRRLQRAMREFTDRYVTPEARECEDSGEYISQALIDRMSAAGVLHMRLGPGPHLHGVELLGGVVDGKEFDYFHDMIVSQELSRTGARGFQDGNMAGMTIGLTVVLNFAEPELRDRISKEVFSGKKKICLAITEAFAGSDVAGIRTTAKKTADGKHYIVNGTKKWITNGVFSDYSVVAVRTDKGLSVLLVEHGEGVEAKQIKTSYSTTAGTAYITYDDVKVPVENLLGAENNGIHVVLSNFNHERWNMASATVRNCRLVVEESLKWANQRLVFGKRLIEQPVIRQKLAKMIALTEANQSWLETITYQMCNMPYKEQSKHLGGPIGLLKMSTTRAAHEIADEAVQIWGGRGLTRTGMGRIIEGFNRGVKFDAILGGAEEVLGDLGVRQALRHMPKERLQGGIDGSSASHTPAVRMISAVTLYKSTQTREKGVLLTEANLACNTSHSLS
ncbi:medium-chain specific acyl-CoA dehydrogenase [Verticillium dahliae VdLs.17]|uniref:Medium-chain specific acyl-CoA dehydrogenase n=1 Tax=Verticillium dahliae (strain VdLs.17 / ATCC MYA-4575 / FGSC 10137) TaxID=498257 RepID=G2WRL7_VERDV|nr:medium-chain specific acyl-CoA dehydrogenase [Verticillium dahliae VdLs.17]EGY13518.1 medium-chain specific acyl-CoA dehydrogenase [Verticillium dahliae VdLs.17]